MGLGGEGAGDLEPALLTVSEVARVFIGMSLDPHELEELHRAVSDLTLLSPRKGGAEDGVPELCLHAHVLSHFHVVERAHELEEADVLERTGDAELRRLVRLGARDVPTFEHDPARSRHVGRASR